MQSNSCYHVIMSLTVELGDECQPCNSTHACRHVSIAAPGMVQRHACYAPVYLAANDQQPERRRTHFHKSLAVQEVLGWVAHQAVVAGAEQGVVVVVVMQEFLKRQGLEVEGRAEEKVGTSS